MKIVRLEAENVKRLRAVEVKPDGSVVLITGRNGQGKSSILDSIEAALGGKKSIPEVPIRQGETQARVVVELEDLVVTRRFTEKGSYLSVENKDGAAYKSPQQLLNKLVGRLSFDPLEFSRQEPTIQSDTLRDIVGLDFADHDRKRSDLYEQRRDVNRHAKRVNAHLESMPKHEDAPPAEVSIADLMEELRRRQGHNQEVTSVETGLRVAEQEAEEQEREIEELEKALKWARSCRDTAKASIEEKRERLASMERVSIDEVEKQIENAEELNRKCRENAERARVEEDLDRLRSEAKVLDEQLADLDAEKARAIEEAEFPIEGLGFDEHGVTLNGLPYGQASSAEQLRASVAIGLALNPKLRVLLIRDGSLLDEENLAAVAKMAAEADAQLWIERVSDDGEVGVLIEDGAVLDRATEAAE